MLQGEAVQLLPDPAVWWPSQHTLFVADVHLGKAATFRALGQPVPAGTTQDNLHRLSAALQRTGARHLVLLGDLLHARQAHNTTLLSALHAWRQSHSQVRMTLVRGNHDDRAGDPPASLGIAVVDEPWSLGPFAACHHPRDDGLLHAEVEAASASFVLAGHTHPVCRLQGRGRDTMSLPCFVRSAGQLVLPAFGTFTGGYLMDPAPGVQRYPVGGGQVWCLPADGS
jgi:DNA ligase-associated metallophosphoesterase